MLSNCVFGEDSSMVAQRVTYNAGPQRDLGLIPGSGRSPGDGNGNPLQYSFLKKSHGRRSLVGYSPWCHKEPHTTEQLHFHFLESPLNCKDIKPVNPKGNQSWIFIGRTGAEAPVLWSPDAKSQIIGKYSCAGKDWGQVEKEMKEDKMLGWHHGLSGQEFEQTLGHSEEQGTLVCYSP